MNFTRCSTTVLIGAALVFANTGCNALLSAATGGAYVGKTNIKIVNDSPREVCKILAFKDGNKVDDQALTGPGVKPGTEGTAQIDENLGEVDLEIYSCSPEMLMKKATVAVKPGTMVRVN